MVSKRRHHRSSTARGRQAARRSKLGRRGELITLLLLSFKGYRLRHRNWRAPSGELDLVFERRGEVVFVEVKTRSDEDFGGAVSAVDNAKQNKLVQTASAYLGRYSLWDRPCRFDIVAIERRPGFPGWRIRHYRDAFQPDEGRLM